MKHSIDIDIIELEPQSYHIIVNVEFNKLIKGIMIIDTGASRSVFDYNLLQNHIYDEDLVSKEDTMGINSAIDNMKAASLPTFSIGDFDVENMEIALMDLSYVNNAYKKFTNIDIAGLLGSDFFMEYNAIIDYSEKKLFFHS